MTLWDVESSPSTVQPPMAPALRHLEELRNDDDVLRCLSSVNWAFSKDRTGYLSHDIHPYPAKFIPQIPSNVIHALSLPGELVWDCFGGSGTTALEALRLGRRAISTDANPLATEVARAKCLTLTPEQTLALTEMSRRIRVLGSRPVDAVEILRRAAPHAFKWMPAIPNCKKWFHENAIRELAHILHEIGTRLDEPSKCFARVCFSSIIVKASWQDGETRYASKPREFPVGDVLTMFADALHTALIEHEPIQHLLRYRTGSFGNLNLLAEDLPNEPIPGLRKNSVDLIVCSPPYANAFDYHLYHRFRLYWLGYDPNELGRCEIGSHLRHQREKTGFSDYISEMRICLCRIREFLRPGRFAVFVIGDSIFQGKTINTGEALSALAQEDGWKSVGLIKRPLPQFKRSFMPKARRAQHEMLLVLRRPEEPAKVILYPPQYKLWPYERDLAKREVQTLLGVSVKNGDLFNRPIKTSPFKLDRVRRLTFTHRVACQPPDEFKTWQAILENGDAEVRSAKKDPKYVTHGIHPYKGKFYPQLAKSLFNIGSACPGAMVLDPFCGSGTVLLEAQLNGYSGYGMDMNPLAALIARAKTSLISEDLYSVDEALSGFLSRLTASGPSENHLHVFPQECIEELLSWFPRPVVIAIGWLLSEIGTVPIVAVQESLRVCLSSIIRNVSQQDPQDLRVRRRAVQIHDAPTLELFNERVTALRQRLRDFALRTSSAPIRMTTPRVLRADNRLEGSFAEIGLSPGAVDLVVTSPPYATALPYIDTDRLSLLTILGMTSKMRSPIERGLTGSREIASREREELEDAIEHRGYQVLGSECASTMIRLVYDLNKAGNAGFRRKNMAALLYRYFRDLNLVMKRLAQLMKKDGNLFFVMGNNKTEAGGQEVIIDSVSALAEIGQSAGLRLIEKIPITVTTENYKHTKNSITSNTIIWFGA